MNHLSLFEKLLQCLRWEEKALEWNKITVFIYMPRGHVDYLQLFFEGERILQSNYMSLAWWPPRDLLKDKVPIRLMDQLLKFAAANLLLSHRSLLGLFFFLIEGKWVLYPKWWDKTKWKFLFLIHYKGKLDFVYFQLTKKETFETKGLASWDWHMVIGAISGLPNSILKEVSVSFGVGLKYLMGTIDHSSQIIARHLWGERVSCDSQSRT